MGFVVLAVHTAGQLECTFVMISRANYNYTAGQIRHAGLSLTHVHYCDSAYIMLTVLTSKVSAESFFGQGHKVSLKALSACIFNPKKKLKIFLCYFVGRISMRGCTYFLFNFHIIAFFLKDKLSKIALVHFKFTLRRWAQVANPCFKL